MQKNKIELKNHRFVINKKHYELDGEDGKPILREIKKSEIKKEEKMAEEIAEKLKKHLDQKAILKEAVIRLEKKEMEKLHNMLFKSKKKYKPKTREEHCADMKIGNYILPIVE